MQAVILCAGKSTRTYPLTVNTPKVLVKIAGKTVLEHNLENLKGLVDEVIIVIGHCGNLIKEKFRDEFQGLKLVYVEQKEQLGTGHALLAAKDSIKDRFLLMNGDDFYSRKDIENCLKHKYCVLGKEVDDCSPFGVCIIENGVFKGIIEKPEKKGAGIANIGMYVLDRKVFDFETKKSPRGEIEVTDFLTNLAKAKRIDVERVSNYWFPIAYPWDILNANEFFLKGIKESLEGKIENNVTIKGSVIIGKGTLVKSGAYIEGPVVIGENCIIGPNCYIRASTSIGNGCGICNGTEVKNSVIGDNVNIRHLSYLGDSILGNNINIGGGTIVANLRHDKETVKSIVNGELIDTGRNKFGAVIGDGAKTGVHTSIYPGRKIWPGKTTAPGQVVDKDIV